MRTTHVPAWSGSTRAANKSTQADRLAWLGSSDRLGRAGGVRWQRAPGIQSDRNVAAASRSRPLRTVLHVGTGLRDAGAFVVAAVIAYARALSS